MHQGTRLIEHGVSERNTEFHRRERQAFFEHPAPKVVGINLLAAFAIGRRFFELTRNIDQNIITQFLTIRRDIAAPSIEISFAHIKRINTSLNGDGLHHLFGKQHALRPAKTAKCGIGNRVGFETACGDSEGGIIISIICMKHRAVANRIAEINRISTTRQ